MTGRSSVAEAGLTDRELADYFGVEEHALTARFDVVLRQACAHLAGEVRRTLLAQADRGVPEAVIYLIREYLTPGAALEGGVEG